MIAHLDSVLETVCSSLRCESLTKQINGARAGQSQKR